MIKIATISNKLFPAMGKWNVFYIDTIESLLQYISDVKSVSVMESYHKAKFIDSGLKFEHHTAESFALRFTILNNRKEKGSIRNDIDIINDTFINPIIDNFFKYGILLFNKVGGYQMLTDNIRIHKIKNVDTFDSSQLLIGIPTMDDVNIEKWPLGKHFYIKINNQTIEIDGKVKWNTFESAHDAAVNYINNLEN